jgi:undecaprenyl-diphosphatase
VHSVIRVVGEYFYLVSIALAILYWLRCPRSSKAPLGATLVLGGAIAFALDVVGGKVFYDTRPFVTEHVTPIIPHAADNGFPSDHAMLTFFLAFAIYAYSRRLAAVLFVNAVLVSWARVAAHIHSLLDIAGGLVFGLVGALVAHYVVRALIARHKYRAYD